MDPEELRRRIAELKAQGMSEDSVIATLRNERKAKASPVEPTAQVQKPSRPEPTRAGIGDLLKSALGAAANMVVPGAEGALRLAGETSVGRRAGNLLSGEARAAAQGASFGASDEAEGFLNSLLPGRGNYGEETAAARQKMSGFRQEHPFFSLGSELAGGGAVGLPFLKGGKGVSALSRIGKGAAVGAGAGGVSGFLGADPEEEDFVSSLQRRLLGGAAGTVVGGGLGAALPAAGAVDKFFRPAGGVPFTGGRSLGEVAEDLGSGLKRFTQPLVNERGAVNLSGGNDLAGNSGVFHAPGVLESFRAKGPTAIPDRHEMEALAIDRFGKYGKAEKDVVAMAARKAQASGTNFADELSKVAEVTADGRPVLLADRTGEGGRRMLGAAEALGADVKPTLYNRMSARPGRLERDISAATKTEPVDLATRATEIAEENRPGIEAGYERAFDNDPRVHLSEASQRAMGTPESGRAFQKAEAANIEAQATRGRAPLEPLTAKEISPATGKDASVMRNDVDLRTLDAVKKALQERIEGLKADKGSSRDLIASLETNVGALLDDMKSQHPEYAKASGLFQETQRLTDAVGAGEKIGKKTANQIAADLGEMTPAEVTEARRAAAEVQRQHIRDTGGDDLLNPKRAIGKDERFRALHGNEAGEELTRRLGLEQGMQATDQAVTGSRSVPLAVEAAELAGGAANLSPSDVVSPFRTMYRLAVAKPLSRALNQAQVGFGKGRADVAGKLLLGGQNGPQDLTSALQLLAGRSAREENALAKALRRQATLSGLAGRSLGNR